MNRIELIPLFQVEARYGVILAPCPFCEFKHVGLFPSPTPHVNCPQCEADGPSFVGQKDTWDSRAVRAARAWNNRPRASEAGDV